MCGAQPAAHGPAEAGADALQQTSPDSSVRAPGAALATEPHPATVPIAGGTQRTFEGVQLHAAPESTASSGVTERAAAAQPSAPPPPLSQPASAAAAVFAGTMSLPCTALASVAAARGACAAEELVAGTALEAEMLVLQAEVREKDEQLRACRAQIAEKDETLWVQRQQLEVRCTETLT